VAGPLEWFAPFALAKTLELTDKPETITATDGGEHPLAVEVAISKNL
jgi:hypothetical protein